MSSQAVGGAVGHNPVSIIIPLPQGGGVQWENLTGYAGGIDRKIRLLETEHADMSGAVFALRQVKCNSDRSVQCASTVIAKQQCDRLK